MLYLSQILSLYIHRFCGLPAFNLLLLSITNFRPCICKRPKVMPILAAKVLSKQRRHCVPLHALFSFDVIRPIY